MKQDLLLGQLFIFTGAILGIAAYFVTHLTAFVALGVSIVIIGLTISSLPKQVTASSSMKTLLRGSIMGINPLLEDVKMIRDSLKGEKNFYGVEPIAELKAVYFPPESNSPDSDVVRESKVYLPIRISNTLTIDEMRNAPMKLCLNESQHGILIFISGCDIGNISEIRGENVTLEYALQYVLVRTADLCSSVMVAEFEETVIVEMKNVKTRPEPIAYQELLGTLPSSLAASIIATKSGRPVLIEDEEVTPNKTVARFLIEAQNNRSKFGLRE